MSPQLIRTIKKSILSFSLLLGIICAITTTSHPYAIAASASTPCPTSSDSLIPPPDCRGDVTQVRAPDANGSTGFNNGLSVDDVNKAVNNLLTYTFAVLSGIAFLMLVYAGIQYIQASGPDAAKKSRQNIINVALGIILLTGSYGIIRLIVAVATYFAQ